MPSFGEQEDDEAQSRLRRAGPFVRWSSFTALVVGAPLFWTAAGLVLAITLAVQDALNVLPIRRRQWHQGVLKKSAVPTARFRLVVLLCCVVAIAVTRWWGLMSLYSGSWLAVQAWQETYHPGRLGTRTLLEKGAVAGIAFFRRDPQQAEETVRRLRPRGLVAVSLILAAALLTIPPADAAMQRATAVPGATLDRALDLLLGTQRDEPEAAPSGDLPAPAVEHESPTTTAVLPDPTLADICGQAGIPTRDIEHTVRLAVESEWHRLGAVALGCPTGDVSATPSGWIVWFRAPSGAAAIVASHARAVAVLPPHRTLLSSDLLLVLASVDRRVEVPGGDYHLAWDLDARCQLSFRRFTEQRATVVPRAVSALLLHVAEVEDSVITGLSAEVSPPAGPEIYAVELVGPSGRTRHLSVEYFLSGRAWLQGYDPVIDAASCDPSAAERHAGSAVRALRPGPAN